jgi:hypothetical protein
MRMGLDTLHACRLSFILPETQAGQAALLTTWPCGLDVEPNGFRDSAYYIGCCGE